MLIRATRLPLGVTFAQETRRIRDKNFEIMNKRLGFLALVVNDNEGNEINA